MLLKSKIFLLVLLMPLTSCTEKEGVSERISIGNLSSVICEDAGDNKKIEAYCRQPVRLKLVLLLEKTIKTNLIASQGSSPIRLSSCADEIDVGGCVDINLKKALDLQLTSLRSIGLSNLKVNKILTDVCEYMSDRDRYAELVRAIDFSTRILFNDYNNDGVTDVLLQGWGGTGSFLWTRSLKMDEFIVILNEIYNNASLSDYDDPVELISNLADEKNYFNGFCDSDESNDVCGGSGYNIFFVVDKENNYVGVVHTKYGPGGVFNHNQNVFQEVCGSIKFNNKRVLSLVKGSARTCDKHLFVTEKDLENVDLFESQSSITLNGVGVRDRDEINPWINKLSINNYQNPLDEYDDVIDFYEYKSSGIIGLEYFTPSRGGFLLKNTDLLSGKNLAQFSSYSEAHIIKIYTINGKRFVYEFDKHKYNFEDADERHLIYNFYDLFNESRIPVCEWSAFGGQAISEAD